MSCIDNNYCKPQAYYKPQVIIGSESWLNESITNNEVFFSPPDFITAFRTDRDTNDGRGGVFVAIGSDIIDTHQVDLDTDCEIAWVRIQLSGCKDMLISTFYSIPNNNNLDYMEKLRTSLSRINVNNSTTVCLGGDFNLGDINWATHTLYPGARCSNVKSSYWDSWAIQSWADGLQTC